MRHTATSQDRRNLLRITAGIAGSVMLFGCREVTVGTDDGDSVAGLPTTVVQQPVAAPAGGAAELNLVLTLGYVGAHYYGIAAGRDGIAAPAAVGIGRQGSAYGGRAVMFADPMIARHAAELADDKEAHVLALRARLGTLAAAQPAIDLSPAFTGAFSTAAQGAGLVPSAATFDPYADDTSFLVGAFLIENRVAAAYRALLGTVRDAASIELVSAHLADAIYHGGVIRSLLEGLASSNPLAAQALANVGPFLATVDGTYLGDQTLAGATGTSSDILDAEGHPIAFTRDASQVLRSLCLSPRPIGGFLPAGANGIAV